jgi:hypothetical protein
VIGERFTTAPVQHVQFLEIRLHKICRHLRTFECIVDADRSNVLEKDRPQLFHRERVDVKRPLKKLQGDREYGSALSQLEVVTMLYPATRREFIGVTVAVITSSSFLSEQMPLGGEIPRRPLGNTGAQVSIIGVRGYHLGSAQDLNEARTIVDTTLDAGINFFDNAWITTMDGAKSGSVKL